MTLLSEGDWIDSSFCGHVHCDTVWELGDSYSCGHIPLVILLDEGEWIDSSFLVTISSVILFCVKIGEIDALVDMFH